jgi:transcriptional regulator with XRE-family HTH domain
MGTNFRENLRSELDFQGIAVKELSAKTKIPVATLDCYLRTRSTEPSAENAVKIARALRVSVEYLVLGEDTKYGSQQKTLNRDMQEIIRWIEKFTPEQHKAILRLLTTFNG